MSIFLGIDFQVFQAALNQALLVRLIIDYKSLLKPGNQALPQGASEDAGLDSDLALSEA